MIDLTRVPHDLRAGTLFVAWRYEERGGKLTKVPVDVATGRGAATDNPKTWTTLDRAIAYLERNAAASGVGRVFVAGDGFAGVDIDHCLIDGEIVGWARPYVDALDTYTEISPSGAGVKLWLRGAIADGRGRKRGNLGDGTGAIEVYDRLRYFTLTGRHLAGTPATVEPRQDALDALIEEIDARRKPRPTVAPVAVDASDETLIERASLSRHGSDFRALFLGDDSSCGGDASAGDYRLMRAARFWTGGDPARMDAWYRASRRAREKWDERRGAMTYGELTIQRALDAGGDYYRPKVTR